MEKNTFAIFGILAVLLLTLGLTSAAVDEFELSIVGDGTTSSRLTGANDSAQDFVINVANTNTTFGDVYVNWSVAATTDMQLPAGQIFALDTPADVSGFSLTMPYKDSSYVRLTANIYSSDESELLGEEYINIYFNNTDYVEASTEVEGCTDPTANNYDSSATVDDGSCTYDIITEETLCELEGYTEKGDLEITDYDVNNKGDGKDDEWQYLDQIEITIDVENTHNSDDIEDVEVKMVILDDKIENGGNDVTNDFDVDDEVLTDMGKLKDEEEDSVMFLIEEVPSDLDSGTYYMYIMTYEDGNEAEQCMSEIDSGDFYFEFTVESVDYEDSIVVKGSEFDNTIDTYCDQKNLEITVPVYNLGDDEEERILVNLYNSELGIDEFMVIEDLDNGDKEILTFFVNTPSDLTRERYTLDVIINFDWDNDEDDNEPSSYDEESTETIIKLNILVCTVKAPTITASLESAREVGQNLIVKVTIANEGNDNEFIIAPTTFDSWADLVSVTPGKATITSGSSQEVIITLSPNQAGAQTFIITTIVDGETYNQPVSVNISEEPGIFSDLGLSGTTLYLVAAIAGLLVLIFLVIIVRVARRPVKADF